LLFIDEIKSESELREILIEKYKFIRFINEKISYSKIKNILLTIICMCMKFTNKYIKKIVKLENDGVEIYLVYIINMKRKNISNIVTKFIKNSNIVTVTLSNDLMENDILIENLKREKKYIVDGKILYEMMIYKMVEYISNIQKVDIEKYEISLMIKNKDRHRINYIQPIIQKCKIVNIVTDNVSQFDTMKEEMKNNYGIYLNVTGNIEKSLSHSDIIINYDFEPELFEKCKIPRYAILFNISKKIKVCYNEFAGINITDYEIFMPEKYKIGKRILNKFNLSKVYESIIIFNDLVQSQIQKKVEQDNIKLRYLIGNNDKIRCREFINIKSRKMGKIKINKRLDKNKE